MIKIRGDFIQGHDGSWVNMQTIKRFYIIEYDDGTYSIKFSSMDLNEPDFICIGQPFPTKDEAQQTLDMIFELLEQELY